ncbi:hypothetical protein BGX28_000900, partial [Mortierella sp. GBA30]
STGKPKGVMVEHRQVTRLFTATAAWFSFDENDIWCLFHSFAFDVSVWEIWGALLHGAKMVIVSQAVARSPQEFYQLICEQSVTVLNMTPSAFMPITDIYIGLGLRNSLRYVILAGEALVPAMLKPWFLVPDQDRPKIVNMYGTTETTVHATYRVVACEDCSESTSVIGVRIPDLRTYVLNGRGQPVPVGAVGELYIGGAGVTRGYLNRAQLTAERFMPDPYAEILGARIYRTGDLVRYLPDGSLAYLGRNDQQVKIRGFRIELGEIEARLAESPLVSEAVVVAVGATGTKRLVAYITAESSFDVQLASNLRSHLEKRLPEYMIPSAFVRMDCFPLTPNGKLDRHALPAPGESDIAHQAYEEPQGEIEMALASIWGELLQLGQVSRHDGFFALGGHSLLAVRVVSRLHQLGYSVSVRALFASPTLSVLAQAIGQHRDVVVPPNLITPDTRHITPNMLPLIDLNQMEIDHIIERVPGGVANVQDIYALSPLQDGILFHHLMAKGGDPYLLYASMAFDDELSLRRYLASVQQIVNRHDILRTSLIWENISTPAQVVWRNAPLSITDLKIDPSNGPCTQQLKETYDPRHYRIDLSQAPLLRFITAQESDGRWILVTLHHHLIGDHSTLEIMDSEIREFSEGRGDTLPAAHHYRDLIAQARLGVSVESHERFFKEMLGDIDSPSLPFGIVDVHGDGAEATEYHRMLSSDLNDRLRSRARHLGVSVA